jgi:RNA polymerase sigma-54 factor
MANLPAADALIGAFLIDHVEDSGYLGVSLDEAAETLGADPDTVSRVLAIIQTFEPTGVMARDLAECMALQLKERDRYDPAMQTFVENLELVAAREFSKLAELCGVDAEDITDMLQELRELDPKPGLSFAPDTAEPVIPDVLMVRHPKGGWMVELNSETLPRVLVNSSYHAQVLKTPMSREDRKYLADQLQTANWLVRALHQRATTILKVSAEIVRRQDGFFKKGVSHLKPMVLRDVADEIEMHESTVSRVTSNKYIVTPRGIFELKYFFSSSISATDGGDAHSAEAVRHRIKEMIDAEDPKKILSDDKLVKLLVADGYDIARRTVAKYRESLKIGSSVERRRQKAAPK